MICGVKSGAVALMTPMVATSTPSIVTMLMVVGFDAALESR